MRTDNAVRASILIGGLILLLTIGWAPQAGSPALAGPPTPASPGKIANPVSGRGARPLPEIDTSPVTSGAASATDSFGYTLNTSATYQWIDATSGTEVVFPGADDSSAGPFGLGFNFTYYENTYSQIYIGTNGILTFSDDAASFSNASIPMDSPPNDLIAVFWDDLVVGGSFNSGKVYFRTGTQSSVKYFAVAWEQVSRLGSSALLTFEAVLYENGDIKLQYKSVSGVLNKCTVGIEDGDGVDGLLYLYQAPGLSSSKAVLFDRPPKTRRVKILPTSADGMIVKDSVRFAIKVRNTGESGSDRFNLTISPANPTWKVLLLNSSSQPLVDTNGDGKVDTGPLTQGGTFNLTVEMQPPASAGPEDSYAIDLTASSAAAPLKTSSARLRAAVPVPFAEAFAEGTLGMNLDLIWTSKWNTALVMSGFSGSSLAVVETPTDSFIYAWERNGVGAGGLYTNIEYAQVDRYGTLTQVTKILADNSLDTHQTTDRYPALGVAPNGNIGVIWVRDRLNLATLKSNSNVYFAVLNPAGDKVFGPVNITNNSMWRGEGDLNISTYVSPRITPTADNRFLLAWVDGSLKSAGEISDLAYAVFNSQGGVVKSPKLLTSSTPGGNRYLDPSLTLLTGQRVLLPYAILDPGSLSYTIAYQVLNNHGSVLTGQTIISGSRGWGPDAVQLPTGPVVVGWTDPVTMKPAYTVRNGSTMAPIKGPTTLNNPDGRQADYVSLTYSGQDRAVLTWMDANWNQRLYYAVVGADGSLRTPPMIMRTSSSGNAGVLSSYAGQGSAPFDGAWRSQFLPVIQR